MIESSSITFIQVNLSLGPLLSVMIQSTSGLIKVLPLFVWPAVFAMSNPILFRPAISPNMTYAERQAHCQDILNLPGPVDWWLIANSCSPHISFLQDYLLLTDVKQEYVICFIKSVHVSVCYKSTILVFPLIHCGCRLPPIQQVCSNLTCILYTLQPRHCCTLHHNFCHSKALKHYLTALLVLMMLLMHPIGHAGLI
jgi:hypothetical protein